MKNIISKNRNLKVEKKMYWYVYDVNAEKKSKNKYFLGSVSKSDNIVV